MFRTLILVAVICTPAFARIERDPNAYWCTSVEINICGDPGFERTYWLFRGADDWVEAWRHDDKQFRPEKDSDGRWLITWMEYGRIITVRADSIYWSRTPWDVELAERPAEDKAGHKRHDFKPRTSYTPPLVAPE